MASGDKPSVRERLESLTPELRERLESDLRAQLAPPPEIPADEPDSVELSWARNELEGLRYTIERTAAERGLTEHPEVQAVIAFMQELLRSRVASAVMAELERIAVWALAFFNPDGPEAAAVALKRG